MAKVKLTQRDRRVFARQDAINQKHADALLADPAIQQRVAAMRMKRPTATQIARHKKTMEEDRQRFPPIDAPNRDYQQIIDDYWMVEMRLAEVAAGVPGVVTMTITASPRYPPRPLTTQVLRRVNMREAVAEYYQAAKRMAWFIERLSSMTTRHDQPKVGRPAVHTVAWYRQLAKAYTDLSPHIPKRTLASQFGLTQDAFRSAIRRCRSAQLRLLPPTRQGVAT